MHKAFTMIELIFVIVIIGILAAVAVPKLQNTVTEARQSIINDFTGTLNRTVGPIMYSEALTDGQRDGDITSTGADICSNASSYVDLPDGIVMNSDCSLTVDGSKLPIPTTFSFVPGTSTESPSWDLIW